MIEKRSPAIQFRDVKLEHELARRAEPGESVGSVAKEHLARYFRILAREVAVCGLTQREWDALSRATISRKFDASGPLALDVSLRDAFEAGDLGADWDEAAALELAGRLSSLTYAQQWAVADWLEMRRVEQG